MSDAVTALLAAVVGAAAALAGQSLTPILTARKAHQDWLRDKRAALCEEWVALMEASRNRVAGLPAQRELKYEARQLFEDAHLDTVNEAGRLLSQLRIYGSAELVVALAEDIAAHDRLAGCFLGRRMEEQRALEAKDQQASGEAYAAIRAQLRSR